MADIYGLYDKSGALRYIGKANDAAKRLASHMRDVRRRQTPLYDWIRKNGKPELRILEANCFDWKESERRHIAEARVKGERLLNLAGGGDEPHCPPDVRAANGRKLAARLAEDAEFRELREIKRRLMTAVKAGFVRNATREKLRDAARRSPGKFASFADLPDRVEDENGMALVKVGKHYVTA